MSQKMENQPVSFREKARQIFTTVKSVAGKAEAEVLLVSRVDEYLRFGNNELAQSQYSTSRNLSVRVASEKKQGRVTTGTLDKASIEKTVENVMMLNTSGLEASYRGSGGYFSLTMDADNGNQTGYAMSTFGDFGELDPNKVSQ